MLRPPRNTDAQLLDSVSLRFIIETGFAKAFMGVALIMVLPQISYSLEASRTSVFLYESMAQLVFAYPARRLGVGPASNAVLHWAVGLGLALQLATVVVPGLRTLLHLVPIDLTAFAIIAATVAGSWAVAETIDRWQLQASGLVNS